MPARFRFCLRVHCAAERLIVMKRIRTVGNLLCIAIIGAYTGLLLTRWSALPELIPRHFNAAGTADSYGSKYMLFVELFLMVMIFCVMAAVENFPGAWNFPVKVTDENRDRLYTIVGVMMAVEKVLLTGMFFAIGVGMLQGSISSLTTLIFVALLLITTVSGIAACVRYQ